MDDSVVRMSSQCRVTGGTCARRCRVMGAAAGVGWMDDTVGMEGCSAGVMLAIFIIKHSGRRWCTRSQISTKSIKHSRRRRCLVSSIVEMPVPISIHGTAP